MSIITFDFGDTTGYAQYTEGQPIESGVMKLGIRLEEHPGARWRRARDAIKARMQGHRWVAWELIVNSAGNYSKSTLFGLECQVVECAWELGIEPMTVAPGTLKKFATGNGRATKDEMRAFGRKKWAGVTFETHDEIDARWVLEWAKTKVGESKPLARARLRTTKAD